MQKYQNNASFSYIFKNVLELLLLLAFIGINIFFIHESKENLNPSECHVDLLKFPELNITGTGTAFFQCKAKKIEFFLVVTMLGVATQTMILGCSIGSLIWYASFRSVTKILKSLQTSHCGSYKQIVARGSMLSLIQFLLFFSIFGFR